MSDQEHPETFVEIDWDLFEQGIFDFFRAEKLQAKLAGYAEWLRDRPARHDWPGDQEWPDA